MMHVECELKPRYDSAKSFYGKAKIVRQKDHVSLYSYKTLVAMIEFDDSGFRAYITNDEYLLTKTTMRHIKEFLKQYDFKADTKYQMIRDYGVSHLSERYDKE